jgi:hypothetical protein
MNPELKQKLREKGYTEDEILAMTESEALEKSGEKVLDTPPEPAHEEAANDAPAVPEEAVETPSVDAEA